MEDTDITSGEPSQEGGLRQFKGMWGRAVSTAAVLFCVYNILYLLGFLSTRWLFINEEQFLPVNLGIMLLFVFLLFPLRKRGPKDRLEWHDFIFILVSLTGTIYISVNVLDIVLVRVIPTFGELILGTATIVVVLEAVRRTIGLPVVIIVVFVIFYTLFTNLFPGAFWGPGISWPRIVGQVYLFPTGMFGMVLRTASTFVFLFFMLGAFLTVMGAGKFFIDLAIALAGRFSGGPAKVAILASSLMGTMTGSATANVAGTGVITIPLMKKTGYSPEYAGAIETAASTGGIIMPPVMGMTAFIMADFMGIPYVHIAFAALVPAVLYYIALFIQTHLQAAKKRMVGLPVAQLPSIGTVLKEGWHFVVPLAVLIYFLAVMRYSAVTSCLYAIGSLLVVAMMRKESRWTHRTIEKTFSQAVRMLTRLFPVVAACGVMLACLDVTGLALTLSSALLELSGGNIFFLLLITAAVCFIFGMGLPSYVAYIVLAILVAPALIDAGVPFMATHMFIFYFAISHVITPPVATAAFVAATISGGPMMRTGFQAMRLGIVAFIVPFAFVYSNGLLLQGSPSEIILAIVMAVMAVTSLGLGLEGYLTRRLRWLQRLLFVAGGFALFFPFAGVKIAGGVAIGLALIPEGVALVRIRRGAAA
ncbi:TRAP transporter permease [Chloroflexota bacterium]